MAQSKKKPAKPAVILVGADKGGVGKTTISRAVIDYLASHNQLSRSYDTEFPRGSLVRFFPEVTEIVDLTTVADQMRILDTLESSEVKISVIDIRAGLLSDTLAALEEIGFLEAARKGSFTLSLLHVLGSSIASLEEIAEITPYLQGNHYVMARNFINETNFFEWDSATYERFFTKVSGVDEIDIPKLHEMAYEQVDIAGVPFSQFIANQNGDGSTAEFSFVLRGYVQKWLGEIYNEFGRINYLGTLVGKK